MIMDSMKAVFLGRFQPFHKGHMYVVEKWKDDFDEFCVVIGSPKKSRTEKNPLSAEERREIIRSCYSGIEIVEVEDEDRGKKGHKAWTKRFVEKTEADVVISGNSLVQELIEDYSNVKLVRIENVRPQKFSGAEIRQRIREEKEWRNLVPNCSRDVNQKYVNVIKNSI